MNAAHITINPHVPVLHKANIQEPPINVGYWGQSSLDVGMPLFRSLNGGQGKDFIIK